VVFRICDSDFTGGCHRHSMIDPMVEGWVLNLALTLSEPNSLFIHVKGKSRLSHYIYKNQFVYNENATTRSNLHNGKCGNYPSDILFVRGVSQGDRGL